MALLLQVQRYLEKSMISRKVPFPVVLAGSQVTLFASIQLPWELRIIAHTLHSAESSLIGRGDNWFMSLT